MRFNCHGLRKMLCWTLIGAFAMCLTMHQAVSDEWYDLNEQALSTFEFDGSALPETVEQLKKKFPTAALEPERADNQAGLECYTVSNPPSADVARFYFCDGQLYQFEAQYDLPRVEKLGGSRFIVQKLVDTWGPADHVGENRWTWRRPTYSRRADFYRWPEMAKLVITDISRMPIVERRTSQAEANQPMDMGFESR